MCKAVGAAPALAELNLNGAQHALAHTRSAPPPPGLHARAHAITPRHRRMCARADAFRAAAPRRGADNKLDEKAAAALGESLAATTTLVKLDVGYNPLRAGGAALGRGLAQNA